MLDAETELKLLIYSADDQGKEYYAQPIVMRLFIGDNNEIFAETNKVVTRIIGEKNLKEWTSSIK